MIYLRPFRSCDWQVIAQYQYPGIDQAEAAKLIAEFNEPTYQGKFHKMLAIADDSQIVGYVSLMEQEEKIPSIGVEVYKPFRRQGYAYAAVSQLLVFSDLLNYHTVTAQVRKDNTASLALFEKLDFQIIEEFINRRGHPVYALSRTLP